ncbi:MAG: LCP family protein [Eubacteriales bacterium]|nr:LCP family protein [Eubacteriales bacterium]
MKTFNEIFAKIRQTKLTRKNVLRALGAVAALVVLLFVISVARLSAASGGEASFGSVLKDTFSGGMRLKGVTNILLLGIDNDDLDYFDSNGNADGIMLVSINCDTRELILTSFMRDTKVKVNDYRRDKLTNVYHENGLETFIEVFENNFEIPVDYYALFRYPDIIEIVDSLGGIEVDIAEEEIVDFEAKMRSVAELMGLNYEDYLINWAGPGRFDFCGVQVAGYMRIRPAYGDYDSGRTGRARYVAEQLMDKLAKKSLSEKINFAATVYSKIETDIPEGMILKLAANANRVRHFDRFSDKIPLDEAYISENGGNGYYAVPDFEINNAHLQDSIYKGIHN